MFQIHLDMIGFGTICSKPNYVPNLPRWIWDMIRFEASSVQTWLCSKSDLRYPKLNLGYDQISDMDIPKQIRNKIAFGLQQYYGIKWWYILGN